MALVRLGKVVRAVGLKGHLGVAGPDEGPAVGVEVVLQRGDAVERRRVLESRRQGRLWVVRVDGIADRSGAEAMVGVEVLVDRAVLGDAGEGRHYWADLEGLPVVTAAGEDIGRVTELYETGGVDVLVVTGHRGELLVPLAPYVEVDLAGGRVVVDPPEGLLDGGDAATEGGPETRDQTWRGSKPTS